MPSTISERIWQLVCGALLFVNLLAACDSSTSSAPVPQSLAKELVLYNFAEDMPQSILDTFKDEYGVTIIYSPYQSPEEANANIQAGITYDIALLENQLISPLIKRGLLAKIDYANLTNFNNISANFRDLVFDPGNRYSVPYDYGAVGLLVRTDLIGNDLRRWIDLWDPRYAGKIGLRAQPREIIGMTLLSLGYAFNSENPQELDAALNRLLELKPSIVLIDIEASNAAPKLLSGEIAILHGYAEDYFMTHQENPAVAYVLPDEGTALWGDSLVISANSARKQTAEAFLNFLLRPDVSAQYANEKKYATTNQAAIRLVKPEFSNDPVIYPSNDTLQTGQIILPLSPAGEKHYADLWARFMADNP